jgi:hypothetical protein
MCEAVHSGILRSRYNTPRELAEAAMPSSAHQSPAYVSRSWPAIVRIMLIEILVLLALSGALVGYLNWSSEAAWTEFKAAGKLPGSESISPVQTVKAHAPCTRKA